MRSFVIIFMLLYQLSAGSYNSLLFHGNCVTCHELSNAKSAPSISFIQKVYKQAFPDKKNFVHYMSTWVYAPNEEGSLMIDAVKKYGLMPHLAYDKQVLEQISEYIYETTFE